MQVFTSEWLRTSLESRDERRRPMRFGSRYGVRAECVQRRPAPPLRLGDVAPEVHERAVLRYIAAVERAA